MTILDQNVPLQSNAYYALQSFPRLWLLLCLTAFLDYTSTINFMVNGGIDLEGNLIVRFLAHQFGIFSGVFIGKVLQLFAGLAFCALSKEMAKGVLLILILLNSVAVYINTAF